MKVEVFPPHGFVRYIEHAGNEAGIVNAARVSFAKEIEEEFGELEPSDKGLIRFLLREKHGTPFEQGFMARWHCRVPIFVMREWIRHRVGFSYNEESGRYTELRKDFYYPEKFRTQKGKPGAYTFEEIDNPGLVEYAKGEIKMSAERAFDLYRALMEMGIAKEQARIVLPLNLYTEFRWTVNARSLLNFLMLRNNEHAMYEIRKYASVIENIFSQHMPTVHQAFVDSGRVAP